MEMHEQDREWEREHERDWDRTRDRDRDEREWCGDRDREHDRDGITVSGIIVGCGGLRRRRTLRCRVRLCCGFHLFCCFFHYSFTFLSLLFPQASSLLFLGLSFGFPVSLVCFLPLPSLFSVSISVLSLLCLVIFCVSYYSCGFFPNLYSLYLCIVYFCARLRHVKTEVIDDKIYAPHIWSMKQNKKLGEMDKKVNQRSWPSHCARYSEIAAFAFSKYQGKWSSNSMSLTS